LPNKSFCGVFLPSPFFKFVFALLTKQSFRGQLNKQRLVFRIELLKRSLGFNKDTIDGFFFYGITLATGHLWFQLKSTLTKWLLFSG
jgi:hypothetical protein